MDAPEAAHARDRRREHHARLLSRLPARRTRRGGAGLASQRLSGPLADSEQSVFWLDSPAAPEPLPPLEGETALRLGHRRWRVHRSVGGVACGAGRERRPARGRSLRVGCEWSQRRVRRGLAEPRARERPVAMAGRDRHAPAARARELRRHPRDARRPRDRCRLGRGRRDRRGHPRARGRVARGGGGHWAGVWGGVGAARPRGGQGGGELPDVPRRPVAPVRQRDGEPGTPGVGSARRGTRPRSAHPRAHARDEAATRG